MNKLLAITVLSIALVIACYSALLYSDLAGFPDIGIAPLRKNSSGDLNDGSFMAFYSCADGQQAIGALEKAGYVRFGDSTWRKAHTIPPYRVNKACSVRLKADVEREDKKVYADYPEAFMVIMSNNYTTR